MREAIRSGRRENFYLTDNGVIDHYAREMQPTDFMVYHALERYMNCHTKSTWVGTAKIAEVLNVSQRTVQRSLKVLEDLKLIRILRTPTMTLYKVLPVAPRGKKAATPLFDAIDDEDLLLDDTGVAGATPASVPTSFTSRVPSPRSRTATVASLNNDTDDGPYKEEQDLLNKTQEQDFLKKTFENENPAINEAGQRIINVLKLPDTFLNAAIAAVELQARGTKLSMDEIVTGIWTKALHRGKSREVYLEDCLAEILAERILDEINLPPTNSFISTVTAALKAEGKDRALGLEETAALVTTSAIEDRRRGIEINRFYFENCKWRSNAGASKAERRKLDNLEVNARVKQRLRERLGAS